MRAKAKYAVIYRHRKEYPILVMCKFFSVSRSGYYSFVKRMNRPEKDASLAETIRQQQSKCFHTYGYRRMWQWLKESEGIYHNPKTILRVMQKYGLLAEIRRRRKWKQMGQQVYKYENLLNRDFHAEAPNSKWVTDISYIKTKQGVLYLSMIRDLYDNSNPANSQPGSGYDPPGSAQRKEEGRRGVTAPQRPRLSIHIPSIFQADSTIRHYAFDVKTWEPV